MRTRALRFTLFVWICLCYSTLNGVSVAQNYPDYQTWHLPDGAIARLEKGGISQGDRVVAFSPDGERLAVATTIGVWLYDVKTTRALALLPGGRSGWMHALAFSPDGTKLAVGDGGNIKLWEVSTEIHITTLTEHTGLVWSVAFSPDGTKLASGSNDKTVKLWDAMTGKNIATLTGHTDDVESVAFSRDGRKLASGSRDKTVKLWDVLTGKNIATLGDKDSAAAVSRILRSMTRSGPKSIGHTARVSSVAFSPDGTKLVSGSVEGTLKLWEVKTGRDITTLQGRGDGLYTSVAFSPDDALIAQASGAVGTVELWDVSTEKIINTITGHTGSVYSVAFGPDSTKLTVALWRSQVWNYGMFRREQILPR